MRGDLWRPALMLLGLLALLLQLRPPSDPYAVLDALMCADAPGGCQRIDRVRRLGDDTWLALPQVLVPERTSAEEPAVWAGPLPAPAQRGQRVVVDFQIDEARPGKALGLCLPRSPLLGEVILDGQSLSVSGLGGLQGLQGHRFLRPRHLTLATSTQAGRHELQLELLAPDGLAPGLGRFWVGDDDGMRQSCAELSAKVRDRSMGISWVMGSMGLAGLLLWLRLRERQSLWFALMTLAWVAHVSLVSGAWAALSPSAWSRVFFATRVLFFAPMLLYAFTLVGRSSPRLAPLLLGGYGAAVSLMAVLPPAAFAAWLLTMAALTLPLCGWALLALLRSPEVRAARWSRWVLVAALAGVILATLLDLLHWWRAAAYEGQAWTYLAVPTLCLAFGARLMEALIDHAQRDARDAHRLRRQVEAQRTRIEADYERLQRQREQIAVADERRRIVRDMHDGLGAQLLSASARLRSRPELTPHQVAALLDDALQELRGVLDVLSTEPSNDPSDDPVSALLGTLRWRMAPALQARGIELLWRSEPLPAQFLPSDAARMHLLRFWQEAFSNVLKHSGARQAVFEAGVTASGLRMALVDDGRGFDAKPGQGIGLGSMRARAAAVGAELCIHTALGQGTSVTLVWS
jgi:signal transduction histidine kinase